MNLFTSRGYALRRTPTMRASAHRLQMAAGILEYKVNIVLHAGILFVPVAIESASSLTTVAEARRAI
jgi:hypothetical protein